MKVNLGDMVDKLSILSHYVKKVGSPENYKEFFIYFEDLFLNRPVEDACLIIDTLKKLYDVNGRICYLESDIRLGREGALGTMEIGRRALKIRDLNRVRIELKNLLIEAEGDGFTCKKHDHASAE